MELNRRAGTLVPRSFDAIAGLMAQGLQNTRSEAPIDPTVATQDDFLEWRDRLLPGRLPRTVNRYVRAVVAGLNKAYGDLGHVGTPAAWTLTRLADDVEDEGETAVFLDPKQRRGLIETASGNASRFLRGLDLTGARPKELASVKVFDFDGEQVRLAHRKGNGPLIFLRANFRGFVRSCIASNALASSQPGSFLESWRLEERDGSTGNAAWSCARRTPS